MKMTNIASILTEQTAATSEASRSASLVASITESNKSDITKVVDAMHELTESMKSRFDGMADLGPLAVLDIAKNDHVVFKKRIIDTLLGHDSWKSGEVTDHHFCRLGKWYYSADALIKAQPSYKKLEAPHARVHETGKKVLALHEQGQEDAASKAIDELNDASHEVLDLLEDLRQEVAKALERKPSNDETEELAQAAE